MSPDSFTLSNLRALTYAKAIVIQKGQLICKQCLKIQRNREVNFLGQVMSFAHYQVLLCLYNQAWIQVFMQ